MSVGGAGCGGGAVIVRTFGMVVFANVDQKSSKAFSVSSNQSLVPMGLPWLL